MWHGYSSYQLVFGKKPNLRNIMTDNLLALVGTTTSETLLKNLQALHEKALPHTIRASGQFYDHNNCVFYTYSNG